MPCVKRKCGNQSIYLPTFFTVNQLAVHYVGVHEKGTIDSLTRWSQGHPLVMSLEVVFMFKGS